MGEEEGGETQLEDSVGQLHIQRVHFQLRRLKKNFSDHVVLTTIPEHRSKVLFTFQVSGRHLVVKCGAIDD